jgi:polyphosphate kinase
MVAQSRERIALEPESVAARYLNREQSDLQFKTRVLEMAEDPALPLLERVKFLSIVAANLDEFYMVRVAGLKRQQAAGLSTLSADGLTPTQQLSMISGEVARLMERLAHAFCGDIMPQLREHGVRLRRWRELSAAQHTEAAQIFREHVFPILTPLAVDPGHPFPYISNRSLNLAVFVQDERSKVHFARVKVPPLLPRFVTLASGEPCFVPLEDVIAANLGELFQGMRILEWHSFRVTRDAELEVDDDGAEDLLSALEQELTRRRFSRATRLVVEKDATEHLLEMLMRELGVDDENVLALEGPLDLSSLMQFYDLDRPDLKDAPFQPANHPQLINADESVADIFSVLRE